MSGRDDNDTGRRSRRREGAAGSEARGPRERVRTPGGSDGGPRGRSGRRAGTILLLALLLAAGAFAFYGVRQLSPAAAAPAPVDFVVEPGWGARRVAAELEAAGLIRDQRAFALWLRVRGIDRTIGEGVYELSPHLSAPTIGRRLAEGGQPRTTRFVIPEGFRMADVAERLARHGFVDRDEALARMRDPGPLRPAFVPDGASLEGYLFPATYEVRADAELDDILVAMVGRFRDEVGPAEADRLVDMGLHVHEWVTLASMVQAEAATAEEMPIIAGVFLNRLDRGMLLQSDPTVAYGLGKNLPDLDAVAGDMQRDHPWNTYTRAGIPPGPIGSPGRDALRAVLAPQRANDDGAAYLYFLHGTDQGEPVFRPNTSLEAHERDIDRFLR